MKLETGTKLGPYEIVAPIGAGGMGEVYRARDTRLGRDVAIKVSAEHFSERFEREARSIAALNHPNICHLYDVGPNYLVMELIEGQPVQGPLPPEEAINVARQIADALEAAHERGIIHRDLKPANIMITADGVVKVLDFGLAKSAEAAPGDPESSPTMTISPTRAGMILGTAAYMSPEQARGKSVDKRADIWAFGAVLYEIFTGKKLFHGETVSDILAAVLKEEPDLDRAPENVRRLLRRCLEKDPKKRLRDIGDAMPLLEAAPVSAPRPGSFAHRLAWPAAGLFLAAAAMVSFLYFREQPPAAEPVRFELPLPPGTSFPSYDAMPFAVSPDGRKVVFTLLGADGVKRLWIRALDDLQAQPLATAQIAGNGGFGLFWSPDSRIVAFASGANLYKIDVAGGQPQPVCELPHPMDGGAWNRDGVIVLGTVTGLMRVNASGGSAPVPLTQLEPSERGELGHWYPTFLPDQRHFLYLRRSVKAGNSGVYLGSIDVAPDRQSLKVLVPAAGIPFFVPSGAASTGQLLFLRGQTLLAQTFDLRRLEVTGEATPIAEQIQILRIAQSGYFSASTGVLVYKTAPTPDSQLTWLDRQGNALAKTGEPGAYRSLALSPDGRRVAVERADPHSADSNIWLLDVARGGSTQFTLGAGQHQYPAWSADGARALFRFDNRIYSKPSNGAGDETPLVDGHVDPRPSSWSHDDRFLLYHDLDATSGVDLWLRRFGGGDGKPIPFAKAGIVGMGRFSPDSRWIAYTSNESGIPEVYVRPFDASLESGIPPGGGKWLVSRGGGQSPRWRGDGKELLYLAPGGNVMSVEVTANPPAFQASEPKSLFKSPSGDVDWDVAADGKRFLFPVPVAQGGPEEFTVVLNWQAGLKK